MTIFTYLFRTAFHSYKAITFYTIAAAAMVLLCMNLWLGYAEGRYLGNYENNDYSTITITGSSPNALKRNWLQELESDNANTALSFCRLEDGSCLIGWDGNDSGSQWFPLMEGEFIDRYMNRHAEVVYITEREAKKKPIGTELELGQQEAYRIVGYGWIVPSNFTGVISPDSSQQVFERAPGGSEGTSIDPDDPKRLIRIIPGDVFQERYQPEMVMVRFNEQNYREINKLVQRLRDGYPDCVITGPPKNSDEMYLTEIGRALVYAMLFFIFMEISLVSIVKELYLKIGREIWILRILGISKHRMAVQVVLFILVLFLIGEATALLIHFTFAKPLSFYGAENQPNAFEVFASVSGSLILTITFSLPEIRSALNTKRSD